LYVGYYLVVAYVFYYLGEIPKNKIFRNII